ncbi:two-component sensor histidine kinase [Turicibacter bilis]|uniref:Circadian input-output histidine kinase CikA n=1 Tax=Turicibacter bilis TaxID=2735723 RepID=A0A9Q9FGN3_9FIRM|nr:ATP-binding protein [Turicibacter bilis]MBS3197463.1 two-component sensor histidine kinase [Turicibacter bilis]UUF09041.1 two-component sensor histidine kinase [Turicibacter bilis]
MKRLFWRLTMMFWTLFCVVILSFALTFYLNYEKNYSQRLFEIDQDVNRIGMRIDANIREYVRLVKSEEYKLLKILKENLQLIESLNNDDIERLIDELAPGGSIPPQEDRAFYLAYLKTIGIINDTLDQTKKLYQEDYEIIDFKFIPFYCHECNRERLQQKLNTLDKVKMDENLYLVNEEDGQNTTWSVYQLVQYNDQILGYIRFSYETLKSEQFVSQEERFTRSLYYIGNHLYNENNLPFEIQQKLESADFEQASQILKDEGYYINRYISENNNVKMIYYQLNRSLAGSVLEETISLFELSTILLIFIFLLVSYILFTVIIRPCYLLIEYVKRCGEGDYTVPRNLSSTWKPSFLMVRNAYLENERLLNLKDKQSQELEFAWKRALVASQAKTLFLAKVSHELKTPLNAIKGYIQLLKLSIDQPKQRKQLEIIEYSSDLLLRHVNDLLDFSMIEDGKVKLGIEKIDIFQTADKVEELFLVEAANKGIDFNLIVDEKIPHELYGDEGRIKQIIINLVSNAIKFTESGEIRVSFELDYQNETDAYLSIKVQDTGKGIASHKLESIFEAFTQENNTISRRFGGTGLGLSISKRLAEAMGGRLTVESVVDVGSTFTLFLPFSKYLVEEDES